MSNDDNLLSFYVNIGEWGDEGMINLVFSRCAYQCDADWEAVVMLF